MLENIGGTNFIRNIVENDLETGKYVKCTCSKFFRIWFN